RALINGIATAQFGEGTPDYDKAIAQHDKYVETLRGLGLEVLVLPGDERYPDSCFVEDPAVVMDGCAVITNPARDSRNGEKFEIIDA
ncbi:arginine deiminase-related protein, partial [Salmonella enterica]|uniref:arginine deiminase-related protein n=1 Tax=Salmonella enterica TaxID=28901 RepID=UPI003CF4146A